MLCAGRAWQLSNMARKFSGSTLSRIDLTCVLSAEFSRGVVGAPWRAPMFVKLSEQARECRLYADLCAAKAGLQTEPKLRQVYLHMQQRWLSLARSYEFSERLEFLSAVEERNKEARLILVCQKSE